VREPENHKSHVAAPDGRRCPAPACGGSILDPFMGSGTTGAAALSQGKDFVGIEVSEHYCQVTTDRLRKLSAPSG
jgi:16S rRNA G966 N2-methylase RsmD